nr:J391 [uncultured bacterium]
MGFETLDVRCQCSRGGLVVLQLDQLGQLQAVGDAARQLTDAADDFFQPRPFTVQFLGALGVFPDPGVFELAQNLGQALLAGIEVKDTPVAWLPAPTGP